MKVTLTLGDGSKRKVKTIDGATDTGMCEICEENAMSGNSAGG